MASKAALIHAGRELHWATDGRSRADGLAKRRQAVLSRTCGTHAIGPPVTQLDITVIGAGIFGLWQAFELARRGHQVTLREALGEAAPGAASRFAGAMLAPYCEAESAEPVIRDLGRIGAALWRE